MLRISALSFTRAEVEKFRVELLDVRKHGRGRHVIRSPNEFRRYAGGEQFRFTEARNALPPFTEVAPERVNVGRVRETPAHADHGDSLSRGRLAVAHRLIILLVDFSGHAAANGKRGLLLG